MTDFATFIDHLGYLTPLIHPCLHFNPFTRSNPRLIMAIENYARGVESRHSYYPSRGFFPPSSYAGTSVLFGLPSTLQYCIELCVSSYLDVKILSNDEVARKGVDT